MRRPMATSIMRILRLERHVTFVTFATLALSTLSGDFVRVARADDAAASEACATASEQGQLLRLQGKLSAARAQYLVCVEASCPVVVRKDCAQFLLDIESAMPSLVLAARDESGSDLSEVRVLVDKKLLVEHLDGKSLLLDPGVYLFRFEAKGKVPLERTVVIREGEKSRVVAVTLMSPAKPQADPPDSRAPSAGAIVAASIGVVALGSFTYFGLTARHDYHSLESSCGSHCLQSDVDPVRRKAIIADVSLGIAALSLGTFAYLVLSRPSGKPPALEVRATPIASGALFGIVGSF